MIQLTHLEELQLKKEYVRDIDKVSFIIPNKIEAKVKKYIPKKDLREIHEDLNIAIDLVLYFTNSFSSTYLKSFNTDEKEALEGHQRINYEVERDKFISLGLGYKNSPHPKIIKLLIKHGVIEKTGNYLPGVRSRSYRLTNSYRFKGLSHYIPKTLSIRKNLHEREYEKFREFIKNPVTLNSLITMLDLEFPTNEEAKERLTEVIKEGYYNKSGKRLVWAGKNPGRYPKSSFVHAEDHIKILETLRDTYKMPSIAGEVGGYRVYDRYNMLPKTVRSLVKLSGELVTEKGTDYSCLHPNIAQSRYSRKAEPITHRKVAEALTEGFSKLSKELQDKAIRKYKISHLSFFNLPVDKMKHSEVYPFYEKYDLDMLRKVEDEKIINELYNKEVGYRITTQRLFGIEVEMMGEVISRLNKENIKVLYLFDGLATHPENVKRVREVMDEVAMEFGVLTESN